MRVKFGLVGTCAVLAVLVALVSASADVAREDARSGRIAFIEGERGVLYTVRPDGSGKRRVTPPRGPHDFIHYFDWSPDGRKIVYSWYGDDVVDLFVLRAAGGKPRRLTKGGADEINPAWSRDGKKIAYDLYNDGYWNVSIVNADGSHDHRATPGIHFHGPAWSADGRKIAFSDRDARAWTMNVLGRVPRRVADLPGASSQLRFNVIVAWSPRGRRLAVIGDWWDIWIVNGAGGKPERIFHADENSGRTQELAWSPDGRKLAFAHVDRGDLDIYTINADGTDLRQLTADDRINSSSPSWSPDGRHLAFSDGDEIYVMNADGSNQRNISQNAKKKDYSPRWAPAA